MQDLIGWRTLLEPDNSIQSVQRPRALTKMEWPPNYESVWRWRIQTLTQLRNDPNLLAASKAYYAKRPVEFIMDWMDTYDPRKAKNKWMPFVFFMKQVDLVAFFESLDADQESGLIEKCRDMGATWVACAYSIWRWLFIKNDALGWGSRKEQLVDKLGDADSIFEKMRLLIKRMPDVFLPEGLNESRHMTYMKLINPENGSIISGEAGDNIGRGGRKSMYFKDEAAHYERPEKIEAALGDNTNVQVDISSVNGLGNVFHRRRENGVIWERGKQIAKGFVRVFIMDWSDHPMKTIEWFNTRRAKYEREGMLHVFAQEVERNYSAAISNTVIQYEWIRAAIDAHIRVPYLAAEINRRITLDKTIGEWIAGLDVADDGDDRNALTLREWIIWRHVEEWGERDPGVTARNTIGRCRDFRHRITCMYDAIGLGTNVKSEFNRLTLDEKLIDANQLPFVPWNAGAKVLRPFDYIIPDDKQSMINEDFYENLKAQAWFSLRARFYKTFKAVTEGAVYPVDELISLDSRMPMLQQLCKELAQPQHKKSSRLKTMIDKKPEGTRSPNLADSGVMAFFPVPNDTGQVIVGSYGH